MNFSKNFAELELGAGLPPPLSQLQSIHFPTYLLFKDVDVAFESAKLTRLNILQQAGAAVLGQANQSPALALRLLEGI